MTGTELMELDDFGAMAKAFRNDEVESLMEMTGQGAVQERVGLPRLGINYDTETDDGRSLVRGTWKIFHNGEMIYADDVVVRPLLRTFEYSLWDAEMNEGRGGFSAKSVQKTSFGGQFPDSAGGSKCGRLTRDEENGLDKDDPAYINSRAVVCNQVIYGRITGEFKNADGNVVAMDNEPMIAYFKRSGYRPVNDFIQKQLTDRKILMHKALIEFTTEKQKNGGVIYWTPKLSFVKEVSGTDTDKALMKDFGDTVNAHNEFVFTEYKNAQKSMNSADDIDLTARLAG